MTELKLSSETLEEVFEELCVSRRSFKKSQENQGSSQQLNMDCKCSSCHSSELDILMPSISSRMGHRTTNLLKEKETCTSEDNCERNTYLVSSESKMSQTTLNSSLTLHTDLLGDLRNELLHAKGVVSSIIGSNECLEKMSISTSRVTELAETASNTDTFLCSKHYHRCFIGTRRSKREASSSKRTQHQSRINTYLNRTRSNTTCDSDKTDKVIEYGNMVDVYQNIGQNWSRSPFTPAEKESRSSSIMSDCSVNVMPVVKPVGQFSASMSDSFESQGKRIGDSSWSGRSLPIKNNKFSKTAEGQYSQSENCFGKNSWSYELNPGLKGDIISNLDKCLQDSSLSPCPGLRLTRSDSSMSVTKSTVEPKKNLLPCSNDRVVQKHPKTGKPTIYWAITKINIYPDNSRTYEVMPLTGKKPSEVPEKSDSVFVLIPPTKGVPQYK